MDFVIIFIIGVILLLAYKYLETKTYDVIFVKSKTSGKEYLVRNLPDKQEAADLLGNMNLRFDKIIAFLKKEDLFRVWSKYVKKDETLIEDKLADAGKEEFKKFESDIHRLLKNYNSDALSENTPDSAYTSYSENKGQKVVFCMRSKPGDVLMDLNTMMFVGIHELAHLMSKSIGHNQEFWDNFRILLRISIGISQYKCQNFDTESKDYCGTKITDTPLKCKDI
jgi:hypothetical protein